MDKNTRKYTNEMHIAHTKMLRWTRKTGSELLNGNIARQTIKGVYNSTVQRSSNRLFFSSKSFKRWLLRCTKQRSYLLLNFNGRIKRLQTGRKRLQNVLNGRRCIRNLPSQPNCMKTILIRFPRYFPFSSIYWTRFYVHTKQLVTFLCVCVLLNKITKKPFSLSWIEKVFTLENIEIVSRGIHLHSDTGKFVSRLSDAIQPSFVVPIFVCVLLLWILFLRRFHFLAHRWVCWKVCLKLSVFNILFF